MTTTADTLRRAASELREKAERASQGPWRSATCRHVETGKAHRIVCCSDYGQILDLQGSWYPDNDAAYIAAMDPTVGAALAAFLDMAANYGNPGADWQDRALVVAQLILKETT